MRTFRWALAPALFAAVLAVACDRDEGTRPAPSASVRPAPPRPRELAAELRVPRPDALWPALRQALGPKAELLPKSPELALGTLLGLAPLAAASLDLEAPLVGGVLVPKAGVPNGVIAVGVRNGAELVAQLTTGNAPSHRAERSGELVLLVPRDEPASEARLAVVDDRLLSGSRAALIQTGAYLARGLARQAPRTGNPRLVVPGDAVRSLLVPLLRDRWSAARTTLATSQKRETEQRGRPADFADPAAVLAAMDAFVESLFPLLASTEELELELEPATDVVELALTLRPRAGGALGEAAQRLGSTPTRRLSELPADAMFGLIHARGAPSDAGAPSGFGALFAGRAPPADARALESAFAAVERGRGATQLVAVLPDQALIWRGDVADPAAFEQGISGMVRALGRPPISAPLAALVGRPRIETGRAKLSHVAEPVRRVTLHFTPERGGAPAQRPLELLQHIDRERFLLVLARDAEPHFVRALAAEPRPEMADPALKTALERLPVDAAFALIVDLRRLGLGQGSSAPVAAALGRKESSVALDIVASHPALRVAFEQAVAR